MLITTNNKLVQCATRRAPSNAGKPSNELGAFINMNLKAKQNSKYLEIKVGDKVHIYMKRKKTHKSNVSLV